MRRPPADAPGLPPEEEGRGQLRPGRHQAHQHTVPEGAYQGVLRLNPPKKNFKKWGGGGPGGLASGMCPFLIRI